MVTVGPTGYEQGSTLTRDDTDDQPRILCNIYRASVTIALSYQVKKSVSVLIYSADISHDLLP